MQEGNEFEDENEAENIRSSQQRATFEEASKRGVSRWWWLSMCSRERGGEVE